MEAMAERRIAVHGHRGARGALPENTLPAFLYAIEAGADYIEMDVQATRDDVLVVCHDPVLNRRSIGPPGTRVLRELTLHQLRQFDCGTRIPTLDEVLDLALRGRFRFNIEMKTCPLPLDAYARLLVETVRRHQVEGRVQVQSFAPRLLDALRRLDPALPCAILCGPGHRDWVKRAREAGAAAVGPYHRLVTKHRVERAHAEAVQVVPWTANHPGDWARLIRAGVDGIITDDPAGLIEYLKTR
jgi:glycerophosphoryl diester phosphodiesterase